MPKQIVLNYRVDKRGGRGTFGLLSELDIYAQGEDVQVPLKNLKEAAELNIEEAGIKNLKLREIQDRKPELTI